MKYLSWCYSLMTNSEWDGDYTLGPFNDRDGTEILPCTSEATDDLMAECMGFYHVRSTLPAIDHSMLLLSNRTLTQFIQSNWDAVMDGEAWDGFLLAYQSPHKAVGRLVEDLICTLLVEKLAHVTGIALSQKKVIDAARTGHFVLPAEGSRSDDVLLVREDGSLVLVECKASFTGVTYLTRCLPKAFTQLQYTLQANPAVQQILLLLVSIRKKQIVLLHHERNELLKSELSSLVTTSKQFLRIAGKG